jgi:hypothetical protein
VVDQRAMVVLGRAHQLIEVVAEDSRPCDVHRAAGKNGNAVSRVTLLVQLMSELVQYDVVSVVNVGGDCDRR